MEEIRGTDGKEPTPEQEVRRCEKGIKPKIGPVSLHDFDTHCAPLITDDPDVAQMKRSMLSDGQLPSNVINDISWFHTKAQIKVNFFAFTVPWLLAVLPASAIKRTRHIGSVGLFDKWVLGSWFGLEAVGYPYFYSYFASWEIHNPDEALFASQKDRRLSLYRKRFLEACPYYANAGYMDSEARVFDGFSLEPPEEPDESRDFLAAYAETDELETNS